MIEATSCGGVVIYRGKILTLYKSYKHKYEGWVLPKGTVEKGEDYKTTALREVKEEAGVAANIIKYIGKRKECLLVSHVCKQLLQQTAEGGILCGFRLLQVP